MRHVVSAVVVVDGQEFRGPTHSQAILAAIEAGTLDPERLREYNPAGVNPDLFLTSDGQLIDRFTAFEEFDAASAERLDIPFQGRAPLAPTSPPEATP